ncbi:MAG: hypothetical protein PF484_05070 [Bacteroidales bacterium]|jgi:hypothetical protein|nr:hypothetical protein [Bacteroidales bacterium]
MIKKLLKLLFVFTLLFSLGGTVSSCNISRLENKAINEAERRQRKINDEFAKEYDKKYKQQTKIQADQQRKMIKKSRRKPKNMKPTSKQFFLFRWLGIKKSSFSC